MGWLGRWERWLQCSNARTTRSRSSHGIPSARRPGRCAKHIAKFSEFFGFLWPGQYRAFTEAEASKAREWIAQDQDQE